MALFRTAVETAVSAVHKWFRAGEVPTSLTLLISLAVADGLFGLYWSEPRDELLIAIRTRPFPVPSKSCGFCGRKAPYITDSLRTGSGVPSLV